MRGDELGPRPVRAEAAEALGTFVLVFAGGGALLSGDAGPLGTAFAFGGAVAVMVYAVAHLSGAHFNPAITLGFAVTGRLPWRRLPAYWAAQVLGAFAASLALLALHGGDVDRLATTPAPGLPPLALLGAEAAATFLLAFVIAACATDARVPRSAGGLAIGLAVLVGAVAVGPLSGASMNPARTLGPALVTGVWDSLGLYLLATMAGGVAGMGTYRWMADEPPHSAAPVARSETTKSAAAEVEAR